VDVAAGPSYTTKRQESAEAMIELTRANPTMWQTHGDLIVGAQDWPNAEAFAKRSKLMLPPEIKAAEEEGDETPEVREMRMQLEKLQGDAEQALTEREDMIAQLQKELETVKTDNEIKRSEVAIKGYEARTERLQVLSPAVPAEQVQAIVMQTVQALVAQPEPTATPDIGSMMVDEPGMPPESEMPLDPPPEFGPTDQAPPGAFFTPEG
jgi:hypothetical protein